MIKFNDKMITFIYMKQTIKNPSTNAAPTTPQRTTRLRPLNDLCALSQSAPSTPPRALSPRLLSDLCALDSSATSALSTPQRPLRPWLLRDLCALDSSASSIPSTPQRPLRPWLLRDPLDSSANPGFTLHHRSLKSIFVKINYLSYC